MHSTFGTSPTCVATRTPWQTASTPTRKDVCPRVAHTEGWHSSPLERTAADFDELSRAAVYFACGRATRVRRRGHSTSVRYPAGATRMDDDRPELIAIDHDDYAAEYVGRTEDGRQFILTTPFEPAVKGPGAEFLALYLFDDAGKLLEAKIE